MRALIAGLLLCTGGLSAQAASYPVNTLSFGTGQIGMSTGTVTFPVNTLSFPVTIERVETPSTIEVTLPADILFDFDKADIRPDAQSALREMAQLIRGKARGPVTVQGYTDALGNDAYNKRLSERRAVAVRTWFATREGLAATSFTTTGLGANNPVAPNRNPDGSDNPDGRQLNRRVTLIIRK